MLCRDSGTGRRDKVLSVKDKKVEVPSPLVDLNYVSGFVYTKKFLGSKKY